MIQTLSIASGFGYDPPINMSNESKKFGLNVVPGDFGVVSLDPECTQSILYTRIAKVPCEIRLSDSYKVCTFYSTPSLVDGNKVFNGNQDITRHLRKKNYNIDFGLSLKESSLTMAVISMVNENIKPLLEFLMWVDKKNSEELIIPWHMKVLCIPFNYFYTSRRKKEAEDLIESIVNAENQEVIKDHLTTKAIAAFQSLSSLLGEREYFFGESPTSLDIQVYSYIVPFIQIPFTSVEIKNIGILMPNLVNFQKRIENKYMSDLIDNTRNVVQTERNLNNEDEVSVSAIVILSISAVTLVMSFVIQKGFFRWT